MVKKISKLLRYPLAFKLLLVKATTLSFFYEIMLRLNIYQPIKSMHHQETEPDSYEEISSNELLHLQYTAKSMKLVEKFAPWKPKCYNRALTAKRLLNKKNIVTHMHIGFRKKDNAFDGHAWITYKGKIVTGNIKGLHTFQTLRPVNF